MGTTQIVALGLVVLLFAVIVLYGRSQRKVGGSATEAKLQGEANEDLVEAQTRRQKMRAAQRRSAAALKRWLSRGDSS